jgi:aminoglycoside phosphotransferase (APT) family kinase protein
MSVPDRDNNALNERAGDTIELQPLQSWLQAHVPQVVPATAHLTVRRFPGGFSNLTYELSVHTNGNVRRYVLRRPPHGVTSGVAHNMSREHDVLAALHPLGIPVPQPIVRCDDSSVIGAPFYLMEFVDGVILRGPGASGFRMDDGVASATMSALSHTFVNTLVQLHALPVDTEPLASVGRPLGYVSRQVHGWTRRWVASRTEELSSLNQVAAWLDANQPPDRDAALIHNDFKFDNLVLDRETNRRVTAILDWEMATVGDPLMDVGTALAYWVEADDAPIFRSLGLGVTALPGSFTRTELLHAYSAASGRDISDAAFYYTFGLFKVAVIAQQIYARHVQGMTNDTRFGQLGVVVAALGDVAVQVAEQGL